MNQCRSTTATSFHAAGIGHFLKSFAALMTAVASVFPVAAVFAAAPIAAALPLPALAAPVPFSAKYDANYDGLPVRAQGVRELKQMPDGSYLLTSSASAFFAEIHEQSKFTWNGQGPVSRQYEYQRKGLGKNRSSNVQFDWETGRATDRRSNKPWTLDVSPGTLDKLAYQLKLRADVQRQLASGKPFETLVYAVADNGRMRHFEFEIEGRETLSTPLGEIETLKVRRVRDDPRRDTIFWLAPEYDCLMVRMTQRERNGTRFELLIRELSV